MDERRQVTGREASTLRQLQQDMELAERAFAESEKRLQRYVRTLRWGAPGARPVGIDPIRKVLGVHRSTIHRWVGPAEEQTSKPRRTTTEQGT